MGGGEGCKAGTGAGSVRGFRAAGREGAGGEDLETGADVGQAVTDSEARARVVWVKGVVLDMVAE